MPFTIGWYDGGLLVDCTGALDARAANLLLKAMVAALDTRPSPTNIILDWRGSSGDATQRHHCTKEVAALLHPMLGSVAAVDNDPIGNFRIDLLCEARDYPYLVCTSLEEAVQLLTDRTASAMPAEARQ